MDRDGGREGEKEDKMRNPLEYNTWIQFSIESAFVCATS